MAKRSRNEQRRIDMVLDHARGVAALEREEILGRPGDNARIWRSGGIRTGAHRNRKKDADRRACRSRRDWED